MPSALAISASRPAEIRFAPFSYFCTCWNVTPTWLASSLCESPRSNPSARTFCPIATSSAVARRLGKAEVLSCAQSPVTVPKCNFHTLYGMILNLKYVGSVWWRLLNRAHGDARFSAGEGRAGAQCPRAPRHPGVFAARSRRRVGYDPAHDQPHRSTQGEPDGRDTLQDRHRATRRSGRAVREGGAGEIGTPGRPKLPVQWKNKSIALNIGLVMK